MDMQHEFIKDRDFTSDWRVEAFNDAAEGQCYVAIFTGPESEARAREYADWKNGKLLTPVAA
jgi:hypothetical protein